MPGKVVEMVCHLEVDGQPRHFLDVGPSPTVVVTAKEFKACPVAIQQYNLCWAKTFSTPEKHGTVYANAVYFVVAYSCPKGEVLVAPVSLSQLCIRHYRGFAVASTAFWEEGDIYTMSPEVLTVEEVMVWPEEHRQGIGNSMFPPLQNRAQQDGYKKLRLQCTEALRPFYRKRGFE